MERHNRLYTGNRVIVNSYSPFRGLSGIIQEVNAIDSLEDYFCFYLIKIEGGYTKEPVWFQHEEVDLVSIQEIDHLSNVHKD